MRQQEVCCGWRQVTHIVFLIGQTHLKIYASCIVEVSYVFTQPDNKTLGKATVNDQHRMQINKDKRPILKSSYTLRQCMAMIREIVSSNKLFSNSPDQLTCYKQIYTSTTIE